MVKRISLLILCAIFPAALYAAQAAPPSISIEESRVVVTNFPAGNTVIVFGAAHEYSGGLELLRWRAPLNDVDKDGSVALTTGRPIPRDSVWVVIDTVTGATAVAVPEESRFRQIEFPGAVLPKGPDAKADRYVTGRRMIDLLVVRPHVGAWAAAAADGFDTDNDSREDGRTTVIFANTRNLTGNAPAPRHLTPRDVVVAIDVTRMEFYLTEVTE